MNHTVRTEIIHQYDFLQQVSWRPLHNTGDSPQQRGHSLVVKRDNDTACQLQTNIKRCFTPLERK